MRFDDVVISSSRLSREADIPTISPSAITTKTKSFVLLPGACAKKITWGIIGASVTRIGRVAALRLNHWSGDRCKTKVLG